MAKGARLDAICLMIYGNKAAFVGMTRVERDGTGLRYRFGAFF
jgi:hypothetical protein